jgi:23S rRNA pseudouridine1911/1915/1917 synthase
VPFIKSKFHVAEPIKAFLFFMRELNYTQGEAQRAISKGRLIVDGVSIYDKGVTVQGEIEILHFKPISRGLKPIFVTEDFLVFDKPSGVLTHPNSSATEYSILDEVRFHSGDRANVVHRIDMETSGLILASRHKVAERFLKLAFEHKQISKGYLAWVHGKIDAPFSVEAPIKVRGDYTLSKHKVEISQDGKYAKTEFKPISYSEKLNSTLLECRPLTGRTHQIRIHLFHVKHPILGDPLYGVDFETACDYLDGKLSNSERVRHTKASRLLLHANSLKFRYGNSYHIKSKSMEFLNSPL